jgi:hypothetical protein
MSDRDISSLSSPEAEAKVIGALLVDPKKIALESAEIGFNEHHFHSTNHKNAWKFLIGRLNDGCDLDPIVLHEKCATELELFGGLQQIGIWKIDCPSTHHFKEHARIVIEKSIRREAYAGVIDVQNKLLDGDDLVPLAKFNSDLSSLMASSLTGSAWNIEEASTLWVSDPAEINKLADSALIEGLLREREIVQIVGAAKSQKTWLAMNMAVAIASGSDFLDRHTTKTKTLYIDYELKKSTFQRRLSMVSSKTPNNFDVLTLRGKTRLPTIDDLKGEILRGGYGLVIVDSLYRTGWLTEENNNDAVSRELTGLQRLTEETGASIVVIDHTAKGGGKDRSAVDSSRGASSKGGFFDGIWVLRPQENAPNGENRVMFDAALRDFPSLPGLPVIRYQFTATSCEMEIVGEADQSDTTGVRQIIFEALSSFESGASVKEVEVETGMPNTTVSRILNSIVDEGKATKSPDPKHAQRVLYRVFDMADDLSQKAKTTPK